MTPRPAGSQGACRASRARRHLALVLLSLCAAGCPPAGAAERPFSPAQAELLCAVQTQGRAVSHCAQVVDLPHQVDGALRRAGGPYRYRVTVPPGAVAPGDAWGVVALADMTPLVSHAEVQLLSSASSARAMPNHWNRPLLFLASDAAPDGGVGELIVEVLAPAGGHGGLRQLHVGPLPAVKRLHRRLCIWLVSSAEVATVAAALFALLMFAVWLATRSDLLYLNYAVATALFAINNMNYHVFEPPLEYAAWDVLVNVALDGFIVALLFFSRRLTRRPPSAVIRRLAAVYLGAVATLPWLVPAEFRSTVHDLSHVASFGVGLLSLFTIVRHRRQLSTTSAWVFSCAGALLCVIGVHDLLLLVGLAEGVGGPLIHLGAILLVLASFTALLGDLVRVLQMEKSLSRQLEERVQAKTAELERAQAQLLTVARDKALSEERERMSRELHDGTAGQLVTLLAMVETDPRRDPKSISTFLRAALDDLRMTIQSLDPTVESLGELLGTLRPFMEQRVGQAGAELAWSVAAVPDDPVPADVLHGVQRIVQEAITNAVRHSGATRIGVDAALLDDGRLQLSIVDNGRGFDPRSTPGNGLRNMCLRAERLDAEIFFESEGGGRVRLLLPMPPPPGGTST